MESRIQELQDDPDEDVGFDDHGRYRISPARQSARRDGYERAPKRAPVATLAMLAIAAAVIAILVSVVLLLVSRQSHNPRRVTVEPSTTTTTPTTTQVPTTTANASPAPPPPVETVTDPSTNPTSVVVPIDPPAPKKSPKLNVTRTSAAPAPTVKAPPFKGGDWPR